MYSFPLGRIVVTTSASWLQAGISSNYTPTSALSIEHSACQTLEEYDEQASEKLASFGGLIKDPSAEIARISQHYGIEGFKGGFGLASHHAERRKLLGQLM